MNMALIAFSLVLLLVRVIAQNKESKTKIKIKSQSNLSTKEMTIKKADAVEGACQKAMIQVAIPYQAEGVLQIDSSRAMQSP